MRHLPSTLVVLTLTAGCGNSTSPAPSPSASAPVAAAADAGLPSIEATTLARKTSPHERRIADEKAC
jgi:hypothetical protein